MKKIVVLIILFVFLCNSAYAEVVFYEDFTFYGEMITDVRINKTDRTQQIQMAFPSYFNTKIPLILNGEATYEEINDKPCILLKFDKLSTQAQRHIPVEILVTAINGKKMQNTAFKKKNHYIKSFARVNNYTKEVLTFPIHRYKDHPTKGKPTFDTFVMFLEPAYAALSGALFLISPVTALLCPDITSPDIKRGSIVEFQFLREISKDDLNKIVSPEFL